MSPWSWRWSPWTPLAVWRRNCSNQLLVDHAPEETKRLCLKLVQYEMETTQAQIEVHEGTPPQSQRLVFRGSTMQDWKTLDKNDKTWKTTQLPMQLTWTPHHTFCPSFMTQFFQVDLAMGHESLSPPERMTDRWHPTGSNMETLCCSSPPFETRRKANRKQRHAATLLSKKHQSKSRWLFKKRQHGQRMTTMRTCFRSRKDVPSLRHGGCWHCPAARLPQLFNALLGCPSVVLFFARRHGHLLREVLSCRCFLVMPLGLTASFD